MACKDALWQEERNGDFHLDPLGLFLFGHLVSLSVCLSMVLKPDAPLTLTRGGGDPNHSFFIPSIKKISGQTKNDERIYPENFTHILDQLLDGYDNRLRPGFGGELKKKSVVFIDF